MMGTSWGIILGNKIDPIVPSQRPSNEPNDPNSPNGPSDPSVMYYLDSGCSGQDHDWVMDKMLGSFYRPDGNQKTKFQDGCGMFGDGVKSEIRDKPKRDSTTTTNNNDLAWKLIPFPVMVNAVVVVCAFAIVGIYHSRLIEYLSLKVPKMFWYVLMYAMTSTMIVIGLYWGVYNRLDIEICRPYDITWTGDTGDTIFEKMVGDTTNYVQGKILADSDVDYYLNHIRFACPKVNLDSHPSIQRSMFPSRLLMSFTPGPITRSFIDSIRSKIVYATISIYASIVLYVLTLWTLWTIDNCLQKVERLQKPEGSSRINQVVPVTFNQMPQEPQRPSPNAQSINTNEFVQEQELAGSLASQETQTAPAVAPLTPLSLISIQIHSLHNQPCPPNNII